MDSPTISVIVPVYNVEQYLKECVDSILNQTFRDFELILVDDGSTDKSGMICDAYANEDPRIIVFHQQNAGAAAARNRGLDVARGEYIAFVDSDDIVLSQYLEILYYHVAANKADISLCLYECFDKTYDTLINGKESECRTFSGKEISLYRYQHPDQIPVAPYSKLILRSVIAGRRFPENMLCEDQGFIPYVLYNANVVAFVGSYLYMYRQRAGSLEHSQFTVKRFDDIQHMNAFIEFLKVHNEKEIVKAAKKRRQLRLAIYTLQAKVLHISNIPKDCKMSVFRALFLTRKEFSYNRFSWYLSEICPMFVRPYAFYHKLISLLTN